MRCLLKFYWKQKWWKFYCEKSLKLDIFEILALKMTWKPQQPQNPPSGLYFKFYFWNQWLLLINMNYRLSYLENYYFSNFQHPTNLKNESFPNKTIYATPIGPIGLKKGLFLFSNGVCLIMKKAPSDSPIWQLKKRELLLPLSFLIIKTYQVRLMKLPLQIPLQNTRLCD